MLSIRKALPNDAKTIIWLIKQLAEYEREPESAKATTQDILRDGFGETPFFFCLIAEWNCTVAGFALYFFNYSTWEGCPGLYLEDLFVLPEFRKRGIGKSMMKELAKICVEKNCTRFQWQVLDWNTPSIEFYKSIGAFCMEEWLTFRMETSAIQTLAADY